MKRPLIKPPILRKGDTIGVIAPSGPVKMEELDAGMRLLESLGFPVVFGRHVMGSSRYMAAGDRERAEDLHLMFSEPKIRAVVCARGGYGATRLLPLLDKKLIRSRPKVFVGSSDVTALLVWLTEQAGITAFHGPMVAPNFGRTSSHLTNDGFLRAVCLAEPLGPVEGRGMRGFRPGRAKGALVGGCLSLLCALLGTPYAPMTEGAILFLEDVNEPPYRIDRMLTHLKAAGKLKGVRGIVFGRMVNCRPEAGESYSLEDVILDALKEVKVPMLYGLPAGHGGEQVTLPLGVRVEMDGQRGTLTVLESGVEGE